jgi:hypothetical protein
VLIEDIDLQGPSTHGMHLKTTSTRGGYIRDVLYRRVAVGDVTEDAVLGILTDYGSSDDDIVNSDSVLTNITNIRWENITRSGPKIDDQGAGIFDCFAKQPCQDITFYGVQIQPAKTWECSHMIIKDNGSPVIDVSPGGLSSCISHS